MSVPMGDVRVRIGYVIGGLGRGGAELQLIQLAATMVGRDHEVEVLAYDGASPVDDVARQRGVTVRTPGAVGRFAKMVTTRRWYEAFRPDVVHGVMKRASTLALLARLPRRLPPVIATDMSTATYGQRTPVLWASLLAFALADRVVTQTGLNRSNLERLAPWLRGRTEVVRNGLDVSRFQPLEAKVARNGGVFTFCVVGTVYAVKNPERVVRAVAELLRRGRTGFRVLWFGRTPAAANGRGQSAADLAKVLGVSDVITFEGETATVECVYQRADALLHASIQEGFPNAVAEGMACGLPIVVSNVSDLPEVVRTARNGFVFDPLDVGAMATAMEQMLETDQHELDAMGMRSRALAVEWFALERFADDFEALYRGLSERSA